MKGSSDVTSALVGAARVAPNGEVDGWFALAPGIEAADIGVRLQGRNLQCTVSPEDPEQSQQCIGVPGYRVFRFQASADGEMSGPEAASQVLTLLLAGEPHALPIELLRTSGPQSQGMRAGMDRTVRRCGLFGWVASETDSSLKPMVYIACDGSVLQGISSTYFRGDILAAGISDGYSGFEFTIPPEYFDGKKHRFEVRIAPEGPALAVAEYELKPPARAYADIDEFLRTLYFTRVVDAPFVEADKRALAYFEMKARYLDARFSTMRSEQGPVVSIIMPAYNRASSIGGAIASVLDQTLTSFELIIVDDGSSDDIESAIAAFQDDRIRLIRLPVNGGVSAARNVGLQEARGEYIAYLDSDNWWDPRFLSSSVGSLAESGKSSCYSGQLLYRSRDWYPFALRTGDFNRCLLQNRNYIDLNCFVHSRTIYERLGGFNQSLPKQVDWELILRYTRDSAPLFVPVVCSHYLMNSDAVTITQRQRTEQRKWVIRSAFPDLDRVKLDTDSAAVDVVVPRSSLKVGKAQPRVSVVIPSYQVPDLLAACVQRVLATARADIEVQIVDNASDEATVAAIRQLEADPRVHATLLQENMGFTHAVNIGIRRAEAGRDIVILNNDAFVMPLWLHAMYAALEAVPAAAIAAPQQILLPDEPTMVRHQPFSNPRFPAECNVSAHHGNFIGILDPDAWLTEVSFVPFFCVLIKRDVLEQTGELAEDLGRHYRSDRNYCNVIRHHLGRKIVCTAHSRVLHLVQGATKELKRKDSKAFEDLFLKNRLRADAGLVWL